MTAPSDAGKRLSSPVGERSSEEAVPLLLTVTGKQTDPDGNTQETASVYEAVCRKYGDGFLFSYLAEETEVRLFLSRSLAWMQRGGRESSCMLFDPSAKMTQCDYETAYGIIPMQIHTDFISVLAGGLRQDHKTKGADIVRHGLRARIRYRLMMGSDYEQLCSVTIKTQQIV